MSSRPPTSTRASREYNNNEGQHPSDDLLLAYTRQQHLDNWIEIDQHVALCPFCREKCREFQHSSALLSAWVQDKKQEFHPSVADLVMQRISLERRLSPRERAVAYLRQTFKYSPLEVIVQKIMGQEDAEGKRQVGNISPLSPLTDEPLPGPFAELQGHSLPGKLRSGIASSQNARSLKRPAIALVVAVAIFTLLIGLLVSPRILPVNTAGSMKPKAINLPHQNSTPVAKASQTPTRSHTVPSGPHIAFCGIQGTMKHNAIHICGSGFTRSGRVWLAVYGPENALIGKFAAPDGSVDITFNLSSCWSVPILIIVVDDNTHKMATLSTNAPFSCSGRRR